MQRSRVVDGLGSSEGSPPDGVDGKKPQQGHEQTQEKGVLTRESGGGASRFLGSSSGIYFLHLVREAFSSTGSTTDGIYDAEYLAGTYEDREATEILGEQTVGPISRDVGERLVMPYFRYLHPLLPFLDGQQFAHEFETKAYSGRPVSAAMACSFKAVLSIGLLEYPELRGAVAGRSRDWFSGGARDARAHAMALLGCPVDVGALEALLAVQVYLFVSMQIRAAYELGGLIRSKMYVAGLHRCPARYPTVFSEAECMQRKRILWSAYALDHHLSQTLGLPIGYVDTDIDVCPLLSERHIQGADVPEPEGNETPFPVDDSDVINNSSNPLRIARAFSDYHRLVGRVVETFNKSLHVRAVEPREALALQADIERWWNGLPEGLTGQNPDPDLPFDNSAFFTVLYHQIVLLVNRPRLSLSADTPEFHYAMQVGVDCGRRILAAMTQQETQHGHSQTLFWPGYMSAVWNAGLIISFACKLDCYPLSRGIREVRQCLPICDAMLRRWPAAARCRQILQTILDAMEKDPNRKSNSQTPNNNCPPSSTDANAVLEAIAANTDFIQQPPNSVIDFDDDVFNLFSMNW